MTDIIRVVHQKGGGSKKQPTTIHVGVASRTWEKKSFIVDLDALRTFGGRVWASSLTDRAGKCPMC